MANIPIAKEEHSQSTKCEEYKLTHSEKWWRYQYTLMEKHGYRLRSRYHPDWYPPWIKKGERWNLYEEGIYSKVQFVIDATRLSDGTNVSIKRISSGSKNHCVPILDHFSDEALPHFTFIVMPLLRRFNDPPFFSVDEVVDFIQQTLEGLSYMHSIGVAHRDCSILNIMLDGSALYPRGFHPVATTMDPSGLKSAPKLRRRDVQGVKYYFIDFGISSRFEDDVAKEDRMVTGIDGQDRDVPELSDSVPYDPFAVDMFILGNLYQKEFLDKYTNLSFLSGLAATMTASNAGERPSAEEALAQFHKIVGNQSVIKLRWRLKKKSAGRVVRALQNLGSIIRETAYAGKNMIKLRLKMLGTEL